MLCGTLHKIADDLLPTRLALRVHPVDYPKGEPERARSWRLVAVFFSDFHATQEWRDNFIKRLNHYLAVRVNPVYLDIKACDQPDPGCLVLDLRRVA